MRKFYFSLLLLVSAITLIPAKSYSQLRNEWVNQVIGLNGGKFEGAPPYADFATVQSYNPVSQSVNVFNTIYTQSVQDVVISGNFAYVAAQDSIVMYNLDNYQRVAAVADSGLSKLYVYKGRLIVSKQYPITHYFAEILSGTDLSLITRVEGISGECAGITSANDKIYLAVNGGFMGTTGKLAILNGDTYAYESEVDLGTAAVGINNLYAYDSYIFSVNKTPYGYPNVGSISRYNYMDGTFNTTTMNVLVGDGFGFKGNLLYLKMNEGVGSYDLINQVIADTVIVPDPGSAANITIHAGAIDYVNNYFYLNIGNRQSFGVGIVTTLSGDSVTSFSTGINAEAIAIDFRTPTGVKEKNSASFTLSPDPADNYTMLRIPEKETVSSLKIYDLTGKMIGRIDNINGSNVKIDCSAYPSGLYVVSLETASGVKTLKFIRN